MEGYPLGDFNRLEPGSGRVRGLTEEESLCLEELQRLERKTWSHLEHVADDGTRIYAPDPPQIEKERQRIKQRYPEIIASLVHETTEEIYSTESIRLGRRQPPIFLGERARLLDRRAIPVGVSDPCCLLGVGRDSAQQPSCGQGRHRRRRSRRFIGDDGELPLWLQRLPLGQDDEAAQW